jgi:catechol 2,3-dioxygenase-like lactoylglutathione lyase family enzyme
VSLPLLLVVEGPPALPDPRVKVSEDPRCDTKRAQAFGTALVAAREARGLLCGPVFIFAAAEPEPPAGMSEPGTLWVPHIYRWRRDGESGIAWELQEENQVGSTLDAEPSDVRRWAARPGQLLRLAELAGPNTEGGTSDHLSMRWVLANEAAAAAALSTEHIALEHVSLHVSPEEESRVAAALVDGLGMIEIARPPSIKTPGRWLQAGLTKVHLSSRDTRPAEPGFPGTAPNHVCFAVTDFEAAVIAVERAGFPIVRAGSLGSQAWFRLATGTTIELQQRRWPDPLGSVHLDP